jgi:DNA-binding beta-propeller fold protein YncE
VTKPGLDSPSATPAPALARRPLLLGIGAAALWPPALLAQPLAVSGAAAPGLPRSVAPVFVLNSLDANVSQIDGGSWVETRRIPVGKEPHHLYLTPDEKSLIVANAAGNSLSFLHPQTGEVQRTIQNIIDPYHLRFSPDMQWFVTAANRLNHVDIYRWLPAQANPLQLVKRLEAPKVPSHLAIDGRSSVVYASLQDSNELLAIDLATQAPRWKVRTAGKMPADVFLTRDDKHLLVGMTAERHVEVWDVSGREPKLKARLETGDGAHAFRSKGDGRHVFVSNRVANTISEIDLSNFTVSAQLPAPGGPDCMDLLRDGRTLLVSSRWARKLTLIDVPSRKVIHQVAVGRSPHGVWTLDHAPRH